MEVFVSRADLSEPDGVEALAREPAPVVRRRPALPQRSAGRAGGTSSRRKSSLPSDDSNGSRSSRARSCCPSRLLGGRPRRQGDPRTNRRSSLANLEPFLDPLRHWTGRLEMSASFQGARRSIAPFPGPARVRSRGVAAVLRPRSARRRAARPAGRQPLRGGHRHVGLRQVVAGSRRSSPGAASRIPARCDLALALCDDAARAARRSRRWPRRSPPRSAANRSRSIARSLSRDERRPVAGRRASRPGPRREPARSSPTSSRSCSASTSRATSRPSDAVRQPSARGDRTADRRRSTSSSRCDPNSWAAARSSPGWRKRSTEASTSCRG